MTVRGVVISPYRATFRRKLYNIELGDQEFFTQFISTDILWAHGLHIVPLWRKQSMASAFLCGPAAVLQHRECVCHTSTSCRGPWEICAHTHTHIHNSVDSHKVKKVVEMLCAALFWSRLAVKSARRWRRWRDGGGGGGHHPPHSWTPKCHGGGSMLLPWKPSLSNIWFWSEAMPWWDPSRLLSALQVTGLSWEPGTDCSRRALAAAGISFNSGDNWTGEQPTPSSWFLLPFPYWVLHSP